MISGLVLLACLQAASAWLSCPKFTCQSLNTNTCASFVDNSTIALSSNPCDETHQCTFAQVIAWFTLDPSRRLQTYTCEPMQQLSLTETWTCPNRDADKDLVTGSYPRTCLSNSDCTLLDGTTNECICTPRTSSTSGYCKPDASSSYYLDYWNLCSQLDNVIEGQYEGLYWFLKLQYGVYYDVADPPECKSTLWEFATFSLAESEISSAAAVALGASFFLL